MLSLTHGFRAFAHEHDDIPAFHAGFLVATFLAAALFSTGFFVILVALHMCLDYVKYREVHEYSVFLTFKAVVRESLFDIGLIFMSLTFAVYFHHTFLLPAASGIVRSELTVIRALGTILPKVKIFEHLLVIVLDIHVYLHDEGQSISQPLMRVQRWALRTIVTCLGLLALAFLIHWNNPDFVLEILEDELRVIVL